MKKVYLLMLVMAVALTTLSAGNQKPFSLDDLYRVKSISGITISPDGRQVVCSLSCSDLKQAENESDLYVVESATGRMRRLTTAGGPEYSASWSEDGGTLYFVASRNGSPQLHALPMDGGEARRLTDFAPGVSSPIVLPGGKRAIFAASVYPECGTNADCHRKTAEKLSSGPVQAHIADGLLFRHWDAYREFRYSHLFSVDLESKKVNMLTSGRIDYPAFTHGNGRGFDVSPDAKEICVVANHDPRPETSTNSDLFVFPLEGEGEMVNITRENRAFDGDPLYSPDGRWIAFRTQKIPGYEADRFRLAVYDRHTRTQRILSENIDNWVEKIAWSSDSRTIFFQVPEAGRYSLYRVSVSSGKAEKVLAPGTIHDFVLHKDGKGICFTRSSVGEPVELWSARFKEASPRRLTSVNQTLKNEVDIRPAEEIWVEGARGRRIHVFVVKPHGFQPGKKYPLILNVHGGPQMMWADSFRGDWQVYPGAGYVVAFPNPHGSTGYGQDFTAAISKDWNGKVIEDVLRVADHLAALPYVDAERMGAMGWSWGGYAMMWLEGMDTPFKALAAMMGVYDLRSMHGATEELWFPQWDLGGTPWSNPAAYTHMSPSSRVQHYRTPCLVITGERDYRVPYTQSLHFFTDLQCMNVPSRLIVFKNDGHWPDSVKSMPVYYNAHLEWFHEHLGGGPAPYRTVDMIRNTAFDPQNEAESR